MSVKARLDQLIESLSEEQQREVLTFAEFLTWQDDREGWQRFGQSQLARAYGPDEPEYALALDLLGRLNSHSLGERLADDHGVTPGSVPN